MGTQLKTILAILAANDWLRLRHEPHLLNETIKMQDNNTNQSIDFSSQDQLYVNKFFVNRNSVLLNEDVNSENNHFNFKHILIWTSPHLYPFHYLSRGNAIFKENDCEYTNCYITTNRSHLRDLTKFDVIMFNQCDLKNYLQCGLPEVRSPKQKYVFASLESSHNFPLCTHQVDGYFNWTWTYRLDSTSRWGYMNIKEVKDETLIGPNQHMNWIRKEDMNSVSEEFKARLGNKTKAAAWFVSNCSNISGRLDFGKKLKKELLKYNHTLDIFGGCGWLDGNCEKGDCNVMLQNSYYFYLAFENSFSVDYVTEKLLTALNNNVVPIVYGAAEYSKFMPDGIYLNARKMGVKKLAAKMNELIKDPEQYIDYFKWKNHYIYDVYDEEPDPEYNDYCRFCALVNNEKEMKTTTVIQDLKKWWNNPDFCEATQPLNQKHDISTVNDGDLNTVEQQISDMAELLLSEKNTSDKVKDLKNFGHLLHSILT